MLHALFIYTAKYSRYWIASNAAVYTHGNISAFFIVGFGSPKMRCNRQVYGHLRFLLVYGVQEHICHYKGCGAAVAFSMAFIAVQW